MLYLFVPFPHSCILIEKEREKTIIKRSMKNLFKGGDTHLCKSFVWFI